MGLLACCLTRRGVPACGTRLYGRDASIFLGRQLAGASVKFSVMGEPRYRVLYVCTHPVQYASPLFSRMAKHQTLDVVVAYCSLQGADAALDPGFGVEVAWDVPLLEGYQWLRIPNRSPRPGLGRFLGLVNTGLWSLVRDGGFDAIVALTGYRYASFWIVAAAAKAYGKALLFGTDAHEMASQDRSVWRLRAKRLIWPRLFRLADVVVVPSTGGVGLMRSLGIPAERVVLTPYVVENDWWRDEAARADRAGVRARWGVPEFATVVVFSGKLQPWKRPGDLLLAFAKARIDNAYLVYAGDGPLRPELEGLGRPTRCRRAGPLSRVCEPVVVARGLFGFRLARASVRIRAVRGRGERSYALRLCGRGE